MSNWPICLVIYHYSEKWYLLVIITDMLKRALKKGVKSMRLLCRLVLLLRRDDEVSYGVSDVLKTR